jgi:hypothetical protein
MEQHTEAPVQNGAFDDAVAIDTSIGIIHGAENTLLANQTPPELDAPPLQSPQLHPISTINFMVLVVVPEERMQLKQLSREKVVKNWLHGSLLIFKMHSSRARRHTQLAP